MFRVLSFLKDRFGVRYTSATVGRGDGGDRPPRELYAHAVALITDDGHIALNVGWTLADSVEQAKAIGVVTALETWKEKKILEHHAHAHVLTPDILELVKREYGLTDGLALWREGLEKQT